MIFKIIQGALAPAVTPDDVDVETPLQIAGSWGKHITVECFYLDYIIKNKNTLVLVTTTPVKMECLNLKKNKSGGNIHWPLVLKFL